MICLLVFLSILLLLSIIDNYYERKLKNAFRQLWRRCYKNKNEMWRQHFDLLNEYYENCLKHKAELELIIRTTNNETYIRIFSKHLAQLEQVIKQLETDLAKQNDEVWGT